MDLTCILATVLSSKENCKSSCNTEKPSQLSGEMYNLNLVAKGINLKSNINFGDEKLFTEIERSVFDTWKDIKLN